MTLNLIFLDIELVVKTFEDITVFIMFFIDQMCKQAVMVLHLHQASSIVGNHIPHM